MNIERLELITGTQLDVLTEFYGELLGLTTILTSPGALTVASGASELVFHYEPGFTGVYHFAFNLPENRMASAWAYLAKHGIGHIADTEGNTVFNFASWNAHATYFRDPSGNIIEFIARHDLPAPTPDSDVPFLPADEILNVSEIGLPATDAPAFAAQLRDAVGIAVYRPSNGDLIPLGEANGLFIVVPEGRVWFPTSRVRAQILPVVVTVKNAQGTRFMIRGGG